MTLLFYWKYGEKPAARKECEEKLLALYPNAEVITCGWHFFGSGQIF